MKKIVFLILVVLIIVVLAFVYLYAPLREKRLQAKYEEFHKSFQPIAESIDAQFTHRDLIVKNIKWHFVDQGPENGSVILFIHGLPEGWYSWRYVLPLIDKQYRLIAIDLKGYGRSEKNDDNYNWHVVANQIIDLLDNLKIRKLYVVGHDWGSLIGSVLVNDHLEKILGFVRMEADIIPAGTRKWINLFRQKPQFLIFQSSWLATYMMQDTEKFIDLVYPPRMATPFKQIDRNYFIYEYSRSGVAENVPKYFKMKNWDTEAAIKNICEKKFDFPILILQADRDPHQPMSIFNGIETRCPNLKLQWIKNASHFDNLDQPQAVSKAINDFVRSSLRIK